MNFLPCPVPIPRPIARAAATVDVYKRQTYGRIGIKVWIYKGEVLSQTLRTTPRTLDTKNFKERSDRPRRDRRDGDRKGGFNRNGGGFNRGAGRPQGGFNRPQGGARPAAPKEGGSN